MIDSPMILLRSHSLLWRRICLEKQIGRLVVSLFVFIIAASSLYGIVLAGWRSPRLSLYVAVKLPALLIGTTTLVMLLNWIVATVATSGMTFRQVVAVTYSAMGIACWVLLSLVPITLFFTYGVASYEGTMAEQRLTHNYLLLMHISLIAFAGVAGNSALRRGLGEVVAPTCPATAIYWGWIAAFALVGCQLSWILRPFVGSPFFEVEFMRTNALDHNFFEFVLIDVLPYAMKGGGG